MRSSPLCSRARGSRPRRFLRAASATGTRAHGSAIFLPCRKSAKRRRHASFSAPFSTRTSTRETARKSRKKIFALQRLSEIEHAAKEHEDALAHINLAIELAEETDYLYKFILRGELWAARWNILHAMGRAAEAEAECDERIAAYEDIPVKHNSYLYYGYRFKAQLAAERGVVLVAKDYMHMALHEMEIPAEYEDALEKAFSATHENASWILNEIDRATPRPELLAWDI